MARPRGLGQRNSVLPNAVALGLFLIWLGLVLYLSLHYVMGRDDVRALTLALDGNNVIAMLKDLHGEGHPAIWYLLLRGAHALIHKPEVLPAVSIVVASAASLILLFCSPFRLPLLALILAGHFSLIEYSVIPRDYGIAMLALFAFVAVYDRHRERDCLPGLVLLLLANCHLLAVLLVLALLVMWLIDLLSLGVAERPRATKLFLLNAAIACVGIALCVLTSLPTYNDAAKVVQPESTTASILRAIFLPAAQFPDLMLPGFYQLASGKTGAVLSLVMFASTFGLIRRIGAFAGALITLFGLSLFFALASPGGYRHEAFWIVMMIGMYWLTWSGGTEQQRIADDRGRPWLHRIQWVGTLAFVLILAIQVLPSIHQIERTVRNGPPYGRSRDLAVFVNAQPELKNAVIISDPDYFVESLPYYLSNTTYLIREHRYGSVVHFSRTARLELNLDEVLRTAVELQKETGRPILILMGHRLDADESAGSEKEGYDWTFSFSPQEIRAFQASTTLVVRFGPVIHDETFDVYRLNESH